jgi:hypothetical protein
MGAAAAAGDVPRGAEAAARALWASLALLALARAGLALVPSMRAWSLNLQRFLPAWGWALWAVGALALVPALARRLLPTLAHAGDAAADAPTATSLAWAAAGAALVTLAPDRVWFVGDFLLRENTLGSQGVSLPAWYPQALPLDLFLHDTVARGMMLALGLTANGVGRLIGAAEAALLGVLAVAFARALGLRGAPGFAASSAVFWGGYLTLFTGYNKALSDLVLLVAAAAVAALRAVRDGRGLLGLGVAVGLGLCLHRTSLGLLPLAAWCAWVWFRRHGRAGAWRRPEALAALLLAAAAAAVMLPRILPVVTGFDRRHFAPEEVQRQGGVLAAALHGARPGDLLNLVVLLAPLAPAALAAAALTPALTRRREGAALGLLALPFVAVAPFLHPGQGMFRDWDMFAPAGMALALLAAWLSAEVLRAAPRQAWLAVAVTLGAAVPSAEWVLHHADLERGLARVQAMLREPPSRTAFERAVTWQYLGLRQSAAGRWADAAAAYQRAAELLPSPHILYQWADAEVQSGDDAAAQRAFRLVVRRNGGDAFGWWGLGMASLELGDSATAAAAADSLLRLDPDGAGTRQLLGRLGRQAGP